MKRPKDLLPLVNFFAETLRETLDEWDASQAEVSRMTGIPSLRVVILKDKKGGPEAALFLFIGSRTTAEP